MEGKTSAKAELRLKMRRHLRKLTNVERSNQSKAIRERLNFPCGAKVALFAGTKTEVQLLDLLNNHQDVDFYLPRVLADFGMEFLPVDQSTPLQKSTLGIMEPSDGLPTDRLDYIVCPGLAFSLQGDRLGQGGGFYDRALTKFKSAQMIGVCFDCQLLDKIPSEAHDLRMEQVITAHLES